MKIGHRMYLMVLPAVLGVLVVAGLAYWGQFARTVPELVLVIAAIAVVGTAILAWSNARYVAQRIERLAGASVSGSPTPSLRGVASAVVPGRVATAPDELDAIEASVGRLSTAVAVAESDRAAREHTFEDRARDYATMLSVVADNATKQLEEVRLPLHILLDNHFGDLNENQEEMLTAARGAAEAADADLVALRRIAELDLGSMTLRRDRLLPGDVMRSLLPTLQAAAEKAGATLRTEIEPLVPAIVGDQARLHDALGTLLRGALFASEPGSEIDLTLSDSPAGARIILRGAGGAPASVQAALAARIIAASGGTVEKKGPELVVTLARGTTVKG